MNDDRLRVSAAELEAVDVHVARLHADKPDDAGFIGACAALDWVTGRSTCPPITKEPLAVEGNLRREGHHAEAVLQGLRPGDPDYARGARGILFWAGGLFTLPVWLKPLP